MVLEKSELGVILKKEMKRKTKRKRERIRKRESGDLRGCACFFLSHDDDFVVLLSRLKAAFFIVSSLLPSSPSAFLLFAFVLTLELGRDTHR